MNLFDCRRFSMCNCLTLRSEEYAKTRKTLYRTYTAQMMTMNFFNNKAERSTSYSHPHSELWTHNDGNSFIFPKTVHTVLFSTFNEAFHPPYYFNKNKLRYVIPVKSYYNSLRKKAKKAEFLTEDQYEKSINRFNKKTTATWGKVIKILVLYDHENANSEIKARLELYNSIAKKILNKWNIIEIKEKFDNKRVQPGWQHYSPATHQKFFKKICKIERENREIVIEKEIECRKMK